MSVSPSKHDSFRKLVQSSFQNLVVVFGRCVRTKFSDNLAPPAKQNFYHEKNQPKPSVLALSVLKFLKNSEKFPTFDQKSSLCLFQGETAISLSNWMMKVEVQEQSPEYCHNAYKGTSIKYVSLKSNRYQIYCILLNKTSY